MITVNYCISEVKMDQTQDLHCVRRISLLVYLIMRVYRKRIDNGVIALTRVV